MSDGLVASVNAPGVSSTALGIQAGTSSGVVRAHLVIISGATAGGGIFVYSGQPAAGNLIGSWAGTAGTDAFGNAYPAGFSISLGAISGSTFSGTDFVINSAGAFFYSGTPAAGNLIASIASAAGTDGFGNAYLAGITSYTAGLTANLFDGELNLTATGSFSAGQILAEAGAISMLSGQASGSDTAGGILIESAQVAPSGHTTLQINTAQTWGPAGGAVGGGISGFYPLPNDGNTGPNWATGERGFYNNAASLINQMYAAFIANGFIG
jgi:hypothetical protein